MFTQTHYIAIAKVIHERRLKITAQPQATFGEADTKAVSLEAIAGLTADMIEMFKADNKKFNQFLFIEAAHADLKD